MKKLRLLTAMLLLASMFIGFNACSSDDKDDEGGNEVATGSAIKKLEAKLLGDDIPIVFDASLLYDKDKITACKITSPYIPLFHANVFVKYEANKLIISTKAEGDRKNDIVDEWFGYDDDWRFTYTLENGRAISCLYERDWEDEGYKEKQKTNITFSYNNEGYLSTIIEEEDDDKLGYPVYRTEIKLTYKDGTLAKIEDTSYRISNPSEKETGVYYLTSSKDVNKNNFPIDLYLMATGFAKEGETSYLYPAYLGIFGNTSTYYPNGILQNDNYKGDVKLFDIDYKFDKNGNIVSSLWKGASDYEDITLDIKVSY